MANVGDAGSSASPTKQRIPPAEPNGQHRDGMEPRLAGARWIAMLDHLTIKAALI
jgi:hypothetical protein